MTLNPHVGFNLYHDWGVDKGLNWRRLKQSSTLLLFDGNHLVLQELPVTHSSQLKSQDWNSMLLQADGKKVRTLRGWHRIGAWELPGKIRVTHYFLKGIRPGGLPLKSNHLHSFSCNNEMKVHSTFLWSDTERSPFRTLNRSFIVSL